MKIGNNSNFNSSHITENLLQRMREAHAEARTEAAAGRRVVVAGQASLPELENASRAETSVDQQKLQARLLAIAGDALDEKYATPTDIREAVVDAILDERFGDSVKGIEREHVSNTLKASLVDDPQFSRQVDNMLILAARKLGTEGEGAGAPDAR